MRLSLALAAAAQDCAVDWAKCGGKSYTGPTSCCNSRYYCNTTDAYYAECVPKPLQPFPPAPSSKACGATGSSASGFGASVSAREIAEIWVAATQGLTAGRHDGGVATCVGAVTIALGECGHPAQSAWAGIDDPVCSKDASGAGGIWQITSADQDDMLLAGCKDTTDYCCNARIAYAHAYNQGGATKVPADYCDKQQDCTLIKTPSGDAFNDPAVTATKPGQDIPDCTLTGNPWYKDTSKLPSPTADQEPCYFGPFSVAGGGVGKEFFNGFYGWGGFLMHYTDSKAGQCDYSPQGSASPRCQAGGDLAKLPTYSELGQQACAAVLEVVV